MAFGREGVGARPGRNDYAYQKARLVLKNSPGANLCWICEEYIDMALPHLDPMAWTADHVQSLYNNGDPYAQGNLRPAHRSCNSKRGNQIRASKSSRVW